MFSEGEFCHIEINVALNAAIHPQLGSDAASLSVFIFRISSQEDAQHIFFFTTDMFSCSSALQTDMAIEGVLYIFYIVSYGCSCVQTNEVSFTKANVKRREESGVVECLSQRH